MDSWAAPKYEVELWSAQGVPLADISHMARKRHFELTRNDAELFKFELDLNEFEAYAASIGVHPRTLINPYQTDVKLKRNGQYLFGAHVVAAPITVDSAGEVVPVMATGYLNLLAARYLTASYTQQDGCYIVRAAVTATQAQTNGSVGMTLHGSPYMTAVLRDRNYQRDNVKTLIQNMANLVDAPFDVGISHDKVFQTYSRIGSVRNDLLYIYGGPATNVLGLYDENSAANLYNRIIALGSGFGDDQLTSTQNDTASQIANFLREDIKQHNSVTLQPTLDQNALADLEQHKNLLEIPQITITGKELPPNFLSIGDRVPIKTVGHPYLDSLNGTYRIEKLVVDLDENGFEREVVLYFDDYGL